MKHPTVIAAFKEWSTIHKRAAQLRVQAKLITDKGRRIQDGVSGDFATGLIDRELGNLLYAKGGRLYALASRIQATATIEFLKVLRQYHPRARISLMDGGFVLDDGTRYVEKESDGPRTPKTTSR